MLKRKFKIYFILLFIFLLTLQGCKSFLPTSNIVAQVKNTLQPSEPIEENIYPLFTDESKLIDIPFPLNVKLYNLSIEPNDKKFGIRFTSNSPQFDLSNFYRCEMEYLGWQEKGILNGYESGLLFSKPSKMCMILIKSVSYKHNKVEVSLFVFPRTKQ